MRRAFLSSICALGPSLFLEQPLANLYQTPPRFLE